MLKKRQQQQQQQGKVAPLPFLLSSLITTRKPRRLEMDDDEFEDLEDSIISGEPSPYDEPNAGKDFYVPKQLCAPARIRSSSFVRFGYWCAPISISRHEPTNVSSSYG